MKHPIFCSLILMAATVLIPAKASAALYMFFGGGNQFYAVNLGVAADSTSTITIVSAEASDTLTEWIWTLPHQVPNKDTVIYDRGTQTYVGNVPDTPSLPAPLGTMLLGAGTQSLLLEFMGPYFSVTVDIPDELQPGVVVSIPEPSTWAMLLIGFAGIGFSTYRRRKVAALAA